MWKSTFLSIFLLATVISVALSAPEPMEASPPAESGKPVELVIPTEEPAPAGSSIPIEVVQPSTEPAPTGSSIPVEVVQPTTQPAPTGSSIPVEVVQPTKSPSPPGTTLPGQSSNPKQEGMKPDAAKTGLSELAKIPELKVLSSQAAQIKNARLDSMATLLKITLTPVVFLVAILLFGVRILVNGLLKTLTPFITELVKMLGLGSLNVILDPTLETATTIVDGTLNSVQCILASLSYVPFFGKCDSLE